MLNAMRLRVPGILIDALLIAASLHASLALALGSAGFAIGLPLFERILPLFFGLRLILFAAVGLYRSSLVEVSFRQAIQLVQAVAFSSLLMWAAMFSMGLTVLPFSYVAIDSLVCLMATGLSRAAVRLWHDGRVKRAFESVPVAPLFNFDRPVNAPLRGV
jgi:FlaA1/EpsC-like NDP-sugar epimerase